MNVKENIRLNIIGQAGSGKSSLVKNIARDFNCEIFRPSDLIRGYGIAKGMRLVSRADYVEAHQALRTEYPNAIVEAVASSTSPRLLIDGLRVPEHAIALRKKAGMLILALDCPVEERYNRRVNDAVEQYTRAGLQVISIDDFIADEAVDNPTAGELCVPNVPAMIGMADQIIDATKSFKDVLAETTNFLADRYGIYPQPFEQ